MIEKSVVLLLARLGKGFVLGSEGVAWANVLSTPWVSLQAAVSVFTRRRLESNSKVINSASNTRVQSMQEGLGGIRDVLLDHTQTVFARRFNKIDWPLRQAQASNYIIGPSPRFAVDALGMVLIALLGYYMTASAGGIAAAIPTLGALALGAQQLLPIGGTIKRNIAALAYLIGARHFAGATFGNPFKTILVKA